MSSYNRTCHVPDALHGILHTRSPNLTETRIPSTTEGNYGSEKRGNIIQDHTAQEEWSWDSGPALPTPRPELFYLTTHMI